MTTHSLQAVADRIRQLCDMIPPLIRQIPETDFTQKPAPGKWSKKEILGHLVDSAANNHQRFIRLQFEEKPSIWYDPDLWNAAGHYLQIDSVQLLNFWTVYNLHLASLVPLIPAGALDKLCDTNGDHPVTLRFIIEDYLPHLEHHLHEIVTY